MGYSKIKLLPSQSRLRELLSYDPLTGELRWKVKAATSRSNINWNNKCGGKPAGTVNFGGYLVIGIRSNARPTYYLAHRAIWKMMTGDEPPDVIDHCNADKLDNRWANFRPATVSQNIQNSKLRVDNTSGVKGVHWDARHKKWCAVITANKLSVRLGRFSTVAQARSAIELARAEMHGSFARAA